MTSAKRWLLPDGVEEILPLEASKLEYLRRRLLDLYESWGYQLVITPLIEYLDSLLVGSSQDLDLHTFKITDQLSGRMMGIRADITPQAARIDAHCMNRDGPVRLCYADNVLHTKPRGLLASRVPIRIGAEMYGHAGVDCDIELICLMYATLKTAAIEKISVVLGHVGIFRALVKEAEIDADTEFALFDAVQRKAYDEIDAVLDAAVKDAMLHSMLRKLTRLSGDDGILQEAITVFEDAPSSVKKELLELVLIVEGIRERHPEMTLCFDLCELRGYEYHTGIVFAAYTPEYGRAVAKGGRYNHIGEVFGRSRPASGFDSDLKTISRLSSKRFTQKAAIIAPIGNDANLLGAIAELRASGEVVIANLVESGLAEQELEDLNCDRQLQLLNGEWVVEKIT